MATPAVLSSIQARALISAWQVQSETTCISLDLGMHLTEVTLHAAGVVLPDGQCLAWESIRMIGEHTMHCFVVQHNTVHKIEAFSEHSQRFCSLLPTRSAPTVVIAGFPMHRIKATDPRQDTLKKVRTVAPLRGMVLDTTTGLGYTAIEAARSAAQVITIEVDPTILELARLNPWSQTLFEHPAIEQRIGDSAEEITTLPDETFSRIIHDPPTFQLAGHLYSRAFYEELRRVLRANGRMFHYIGDLQSTAGHGVAKGVVRRLKEAGFERIVRKPAAFGVVAYK